jgi:hypothetical protein
MPRTEPRKDPGPPRQTDVGVENKGPRTEPRKDGSAPKNTDADKRGNGNAYGHTDDPNVKGRGIEGEKAAKPHDSVATPGKEKKTEEPPRRDEPKRETRTPAPQLPVAPPRAPDSLAKDPRADTLVKPAKGGKQEPQLKQEVEEKSDSLAKPGKGGKKDPPTTEAETKRNDPNDKRRIPKP